MLSCRTTATLRLVAAGSSDRRLALGLIDQRTGGRRSRIQHPEAAAAFSLTGDVTAEFADIVDER